MSAYVQRRMFTVKDYHRMADAGILTEDDRVELIEGEIVEMAPIGGPHAGVVNRLNKLFNERLRDRTVVSIQNPVKMSEFNEPQPDVALLVPRKDFYGSALPRREDAQLIVEVADTSLAISKSRCRCTQALEFRNSGSSIHAATSCMSVDVRVFADTTTCANWVQGIKIAPLAFADVEFTIDEILGS